LNEQLERDLAAIIAADLGDRFSDFDDRGLIHLADRIILGLRR